MDHSIPQDEYFEWEDIILYQAPSEGTSTSSGKDLSCHQTSTLEYRRTFTHTFDHGESDLDDFQWAGEMSASSTTNSVQTSTSTSFAFNSPIDFPSYEGIESGHAPRSSFEDEGIDIGLGGLETVTSIMHGFAFPAPPANLPKLHTQADTKLRTTTTSRPALSRPTVSETRDCSSLSVQPFQNVNYLLHPWREEDVAASWKHLVTKRKTWGTGASDVSELDHSSWKRHNTMKRLENTAWRSWSKLRFGCGTTSPRSINWLKDCDDTCLYGPFSVSLSDLSSSSRPSSPSPQVSPASSTSRDTRTPNSKSDSRATTPSTRPILKKLSIAEILRRGSLPTFTITASGSSASHSPVAQPPGQLSIQGCPLSDNSPLTYLQTSHLHEEFSTPIPTRALSSGRTKRTVKFLPEVRQYIIVNPIGDRKIHRTVKKARSRTLEEDTSSVGKEVSEPSHWSPDSMWSYNQDQGQGKSGSESESESCEGQQDAEWTWLGVVLEEDEDPAMGGDYFSSKRLRARLSRSGTPSPPPVLPKASNSGIGEGSLSYYYGRQHSQTDASQPATETVTEVEADDPIDYLLSCTDDPGNRSLSPSSSSSASDEQSSSASDESSDDELPAFASPDVGIVRDEKLGRGQEGGMGIATGVGMGFGIGIVDDERHRLYAQVMEEFELGY